MKTFTIARMEQIVVIQTQDYTIEARFEKEAIKKLKKMDYLERECRDEYELGETWKPLEIIEIVKEDD